MLRTFTKYGAAVATNHWCCYSNDEQEINIHQQGEDANHCCHGYTHIYISMLLLFFFLLLLLLLLQITLVVFLCMLFQSNSSFLLWCSLRKHVVQFLRLLYLYSSTHVYTASNCF